MACADANTTLYNHSEFRFGIAAYSSSHLRVLGLNISSTGGDGMYFEDTDNVHVKDVALVDNFRQVQFTTIRYLLRFSTVLHCRFDHF